jgi:hypothetical protein
MPATVEKSNRRANVFVSYSRKDLPFAQHLVADLAAPDFEAFIDKTDIAPGPRPQDDHRTPIPRDDNTR